MGKMVVNVVSHTQVEMSININTHHIEEVFIPFLSSKAWEKFIRTTYSQTNHVYPFIDQDTLKVNIRLALTQSDSLLLASILQWLATDPEEYNDDGSVIFKLNKYPDDPITKEIHWDHFAMAGLVTVYRYADNIYCFQDGEDPNKVHEYHQKRNHAFLQLLRDYQNHLCTSKLPF